VVFCLVIPKNHHIRVLDCVMIVRSAESLLLGTVPDELLDAL